MNIDNNIDYANQPELITEALIKQRCAQAKHLLNVGCLALSVAINMKPRRPKSLSPNCRRNNTPPRLV